MCYCNILCYGQFWFTCGTFLRYRATIVRTKRPTFFNSYNFSEIISYFNQNKIILMLNISKSSYLFIKFRGNDLLFLANAMRRIVCISLFFVSFHQIFHKREAHVNVVVGQISWAKDKPVWQTAHILYMAS